ncbi:MAG TPA: uracil-DNA glycosylase [Gammaproteobacteria bacterium]|nr:uracil-DNA glycosylase [Gammaproteobacteria bacterium]
MSSSARESYLRALGIDVYRLRGREGPAADEPPDAGELEVAREPAAGTAGTGESADPAGLGWDRLAAVVSACALCGLHETRTQTVFGVGRRDADLMVIGEAPGADEDRQGEPFVGRAGKLLNAMLRAIGLGREDVYIANILKCRPPNNRDPAPAEAASCTPYLERQIELVAPRAVLAVGRVAAQHLLQSDQAIGRLRGKALTFGPERIPIVVTYHPAYLLRSPEAKAKAWQDLCLVRRLIRDTQ